MSRALITCLAVLSILLGAGLVLSAQDKPGPPARAAAAKAAPTIVNLNTATPAELATLPGIGPKMAQLIIEHREKQGGFKKVEELMNVKGVGEKTFLKLKPRVTVGASTEAARQ